VVIWLCSETVDEDPAGHVQGLLGIGGHLVTATRNPVASYIPISPDQPEAVAFARESNGVHIPELDTVLDDGSPLHTYCIGDGPGGVVERIHRTVYAELGIPYNRVLPTRGPRLTADDVRTSLRALWDDDRLAGSPVAAALSGSAAPADESAAARADRTRRILLATVEHAVGHESDIYRVVQESFLRRPGETVAEPLPVSRATRYRLLRRALDAVAAELGERN
jgi:hypothetical protein